jgi:hypothetical protein
VKPAGHKVRAVEKMGVESGSVRRMATPADRARPVPKSMIFLANWLSSKVSAVGPFQCVQRVLEPYFRLRAWAISRSRAGSDQAASPASIEGASRAPFTKSCVPLRGESL